MLRVRDGVPGAATTPSHGNGAGVRREITDGAACGPLVGRKEGTGKKALPVWGASAADTAVGTRVAT